MIDEKTVQENPRYTKYHPKWHRVRMPIFWWVHQWPHLRFILRELTSVPVAFYAIVLLFHVRAVAQGQEAYADFLSLLQSPIPIVLHAVAFVFVIFHSITWFNLAPKALVIRIGNKRIADWMILVANYFSWVVITSLVAWLLLTT